MKKNLLKRIFAVSLAVTMTLSVPAVTQTAGMSALTASAAGSAPTTLIDSGICGSTATYTLDSKGTLTISGEGRISDFAFGGGTYAKKDDIRTLVFAENSRITEIGEEAFSGLDYLNTIIFPASLTYIGDSAFSNAIGLENITFTGSELEVGFSAFTGAASLSTLEIGVTDSLTLHETSFGQTGLKNVTIDTARVKLHPYAFSGDGYLETIDFTAHDGTLIEGVLYALPETARVTVQPFSKIYHPASKYFYGPSVAYDTYQPQYDHAILFWEDTGDILAAAQADEAGVGISDVKESREYITNDNISGLFTDAQATITGTMEGDGSFETPYLIRNAQNWKYLDFLCRIGKLNGSYYGWDRGSNVKLMADLTLSDKDGTFTSIGGGKHRDVHNSDYSYIGNFDGNGHTITLDVDHDGGDGCQGFGLFAKTDGAYIKNLHISGRIVSTEQYTGLFVGYLGSNDRIYNCSSDAQLVLKGNGDFFSGSFVGQAYHPDIENCRFTGKIIGDSEEGDPVTAVGGFIGYLNGSNASGRIMRNCYFAPSQIKVSNTNSSILYRAYYGSYSGWVGFETVENNYYNAEGAKLQGPDQGDLDQGVSDADGIESLNETEYWDHGALTMPQATVQANPGTRNFVYTGGEHRLMMDLQADGYNVGSSVLSKGDSFRDMPGGGWNGYVFYKINDGEWSATPPVATEVGEYTIYMKAAGDPSHRDSDIQSIQVSISEPQSLPGSGTAGDPYTISNDLEWSIFCDMRDTDGKYFKLVSDIVVSENRASKRGNNHPLEFNGFFDGDGHKITLYYISRGTSDSLFGKLVGKWSYDTGEYLSV